MTDLLVFRALWGMEDPTERFERKIERIAEAGYDGVEGFVLASSLPAREFAAIVRANGLRLIMAGQVNTQAELAPALEQLAGYEPIKIGIHPGRDSMTRDEASAFFEEALRVEERLGIPVAHETHRGRILFTPWDTLHYLRQFESLKLVADYSHWVNVCERLPDDRAEALTLANQRAAHIHNRVGYEEGPQAPDPAAPEYAAQRAWHEAQWQQIIAHRRAAGDAFVTATPEYGPPPYLHTLPHTNVPVADNWQVCLWGMQQIRGLMI